MVRIDVSDEEQLACFATGPRLALLIRNKPDNGFDMKLDIPALADDRAEYYGQVVKFEGNYNYTKWFLK